MKIGVIMGGISSEREVSLKTGRGMVENLNKEKYEIVPIVIDTKVEIIEKTKDIDFALLALHGKFGEDGNIQAVFEALDIPYSGCGVLTSALCMNKNLTKKIIKEEGLYTAPWIMVRNTEELQGEAVYRLGFPLVVKPNCGGSSVGTFIVNNENELYEMVEKALSYDSEVMLEKYLAGEELTVPMLNGEVLPILSIKPVNNFFDYFSKYEDNGAIEEIKILDKELETLIKEMSRKCWEVFKCEVYARIDIIVSEGIPYILEINTLPGMTKNSLFPKSAKAIGLSYSELLDAIIEYSINVR